MTNHPNRTKNPHRPLQILRDIGHKYPLAWAWYDRFRQERGKEVPDWPDWCYCPMASAYSIISQDSNLNGNLAASRDISILAALAAWRVSQGIYRFDTTLAAAIMDTPITDLPINVLYRLPEWCVYVEAPPDLLYYDEGLNGFFAHLEHDVNTGRSELRLVFDKKNGEVFGLPLHLTVNNLVESINLAIAEGKKQPLRNGHPFVTAMFPSDHIGIELAGIITPIINLLLYTCTVNADLGGRAAPERPKAKKTKRGWRLFATDKPTVWDVGVRLGAALRAAYLGQQTEFSSEVSGSGRVRPRAHIRRAHWHTYLTGEGKTDRILKWLTPVLVNVEDLSPLPVTMRKVD